ncbi:MAG: hypothetical protein ACI9EW_002253 [Cellvibrionaceae bacterium]|jgi:hypothetical protein
MFGIADVYSIFFLVLAVLIAFPGMIALIVFGLPKLANRSTMRVEQTPVACLMLGLPVVAFVGGMAAVLISAGGPLAAIGATFIVILTLVSRIGVAGVVLLIGRRMFGTAETIPLKPVLMGALAYELAALFPIIGWVFILPILFVLTTGAGLFALLRWVPSRRRRGGDILPFEDQILVPTPLIPTEGFSSEARGARGAS